MLQIQLFMVHSVCFNDKIQSGMHMNIYAADNSTDIF